MIMSNDIYIYIYIYTSYLANIADVLRSALDSSRYLWTEPGARCGYVLGGLGIQCYPSLPFAATLNHGMGLCGFD